MGIVKFLYALIETYMTQIPSKFLSDLDKTQGRLQSWYTDLGDHKIKTYLEHPVFQTGLIFTIPYFGEKLRSFGKPVDQADLIRKQLEDELAKELENE